MNNPFYPTNLCPSLIQQYLRYLSSNLPQYPLTLEQAQGLFANRSFQHPIFLPPYAPHMQEKAIKFTEEMQTPNTLASSKEEDFQSNLKVKILKFEEDTLLCQQLLKTETETDASHSYDLKIQIDHMVRYFIQEFDNNNLDKSEHQRRTYTSNPALLGLFDTLKEKYSSAWKCREDMLRLALRKALTFLRDSLRKQLNISAKAASAELCKRYSGGKLTTCSNEEEIMNYLLPYKKNSKYSTPNLCFIREIFASEAFADDYAQYLLRIDHILDVDNDKKIPKFVDFLLSCIENSTLQKVKTFKRLPWLKTWLRATKIIAAELLETNTGISHQDGQNTKTRFE